jgi:ribosomal protein S18 acetylase RimI-like enzyme
MSLYTLPTHEVSIHFPTPKGVSICESIDIDLLTSLSGASTLNILQRLANDHKAFVAFYNNKPAGFGWVASGKAIIGELNHELVLPPAHRYLWNFKTLEQFRGLGIYPALLQYIIQLESATAKQFWIIHAPENQASQRGIEKAGFRYVGKLFYSHNQTTIESTPVSISHTQHLDYMNITISPERPVSCWNCSSPFLKKRKPYCCCHSESKTCIGKDELVFAH